MNSVHKDKYVEIFIDHEHSLVMDVWTEASEEIYIDEQIFKKFLITWRDIVISYNIKYGLTDMRNFRFYVPPKIQEKEVKEIMRVVSDHGFQKNAFIVTDDLVQLLMAEQIKDEYEDLATHEIGSFFLTKEEALAWLLDSG